MKKMTMSERKDIARHLLRDLGDSYFRELDYEELQAFYGAKCDCECVPTTAVCASEEARRILGEPEASKIVMYALERSR